MTEVLWQQGSQTDDKWLPSACYMCYGGACGVLVHIVDGKVVGIQGDPTNPMNRGRLCAKGLASPLGLYNPNRVKKPLIRTNPKKSFGENPEWKEISLDEANGIILERLSKVRKSDPRKLVVGSFDTQATWLLRVWTSVFGTPNVWLASAGYYCGNGEHPMMLMSHGTFLSGADLEHCEYFLQIGTGFGHLGQHIPVFEAKQMANARMRGMKLVVVDPVCTNSAAKADEWIPIRPGTDAAFALTIANLLVNEHNCHDSEFLKKYTNAPYLVKESDGRYLRDRATNKPLIWDCETYQPLPFDSADARSPAVVGSYEIEGVSCHPSFQLLKDHLAQYTPPRCQEITTVNANTIRRVAKEMAEKALQRKEITIQDKTLPYRPVAIDYYRGPSAHKHGWWNGFSVHLLNILLGAMDVPGGHLGLDVMGPGWMPKIGPDGFLIAGGEARGALPYPPRRIRTPETAELLELFPVAVYSRPMLVLNLLENRFGLPYTPEVLINGRTNFLMSSADPVRTAQAVSKFPFMVSFALELNETSELADIVMPDTHFLERLDPMINGEYLHSSGPGPWYWTYRLPVSRPPSGIRHWLAVLLEWSEKLGFIEDIYSALNAKYDLQGQCRLDRTKRYSYEEIVNAISLARFGKDLDWFREHGHVETREKKIEETYSRLYHKGRMPVYLEHLLDVGKHVEQFTHEELGLKDWDTSDYKALPDWRPCPAFEEKEDSEFDLYLVNYKLPYHSHTSTMENPWLRNISEASERDLYVQINSLTAKRKNLRDGQVVWIESKEGVRAKATLKTSESVHEEVLAAPGILGHWARGMPHSRGKGFNVNAFIPLRLDRIDPVSSALDTCVKVALRPE